MPSTLLNSVNLVSQISSGSDTMQCRNAVLTTCESLLQLGEAWRKSDFGEGHCRLQNYSSTPCPATPIRPVGCQHTAPNSPKAIRAAHHESQPTAPQTPNNLKTLGFSFWFSLRRNHSSPGLDITVLVKEDPSKEHVGYPLGIKMHFSMGKLSN